MKGIEFKNEYGDQCSIKLSENVLYFSKTTKRPDKDWAGAGAAAGNIADGVKNTQIKLSNNALLALTHLLLNHHGPGVFDDN